jgi:succinate dehydrogenase / fumarate reductase, cytochrome b subunit
MSDRPVFLNLFHIHFPVAALVSIGHRATGIMLVLLIPVLIMALDLSTTAAGYAQLVAYLHSTWGRAGLFIVIWAFAHHFFAGIRFLLLDFNVGVDKKIKTQSAWLVHGSALSVALLAAGALWL